MRHISRFVMFTHRPIAARFGLAILLVMISVGIIGCPWLNDDDDKDTNPATPNITPLPGYELRNFQAIRPEYDVWCAWVRPDDVFHVNLPDRGDYLFTITTRQAAFRVVARVYQGVKLVFWLQTNDQLVSATAHAGIIHAPNTTEAIPVKEGDYQPPQIWPIAPYVTLFAWPTNGGIGAWDQIFAIDSDARVITLAETKDGVLDFWDCGNGALPPITPIRTNTPVVGMPTITPVGVTPTPTMTPGIPTVTPTITSVTPTVTPTLPPVVPTVTPTIAPPTPTITPTLPPVVPTVTPTIAPPTPTITPTLPPVVPTVTPTIAPPTPTITPTVEPTVTYTMESCTWDDVTMRTTSVTISPAIAGIQLGVEVYDRRSAIPGTPVETGTYTTDFSGTASHDFSSGGCPILYAVWSFVNASQGTNSCTTADVEPPC